MGAHQIPNTWLLGYARSAEWNGERVDIGNLFKKVKPLSIFSVGVLATPSGSMEVYLDRRRAFIFDPTERGPAPITTDEPLYAVVDCVGAIKEAEVLEDSLPPSQDELEADGEEPLSP